MAEKTFAKMIENATERSRDMNVSLGERLKAVADEVRRLSPEFADIVDRTAIRTPVAAMERQDHGPPVVKVGETDKAAALVGQDEFRHRLPWLRGALAHIVRREPRDHWVGDEKRRAKEAGGFDIAPYQGNETWMLPIPATFIVGRDGVVKARYIDPDYRRRMDLHELLAALKSAL
jgi:hypothetical protein